MLPKANRIPSPEIRNVLRSGRRISNAYMQFIFLPNRGNAPRFAFVVATSVDKRATKRNRIKRLMREAVRALLPEVAGNNDIILQARSAQEAEIKNSIEELLRRTHLLT